jgi:hypothetical protein
MPALASLIGATPLPDGDAGVGHSSTGSKPVSQSYWKVAITACSENGDDLEVLRHDPALLIAYNRTPEWVRSSEPAEDLGLENLVLDWWSAPQTDRGILCRSRRGSER